MWKYYALNHISSIFNGLFSLLVFKTHVSNGQIFELKIQMLMNNMLIPIFNKWHNCKVQRKCNMITQYVNNIKTCRCFGVNNIVEMHNTL